MHGHDDKLLFVPSIYKPHRLTRYIHIKQEAEASSCVLFVFNDTDDDYFKRAIVVYFVIVVLN
jgi:hypothetical protein